MSAPTHARPLRRGFLAGLSLACLGAGALLAWWRTRPVAGDDAAAVETFFSARWNDAEGRAFDTAPLKGRPLVINFWATWCPPCVEEMPELELLHRELSPSGIQIIGIGIDSEAKIRQFSEKHRFSYPLLPAGASGAELSRAFGNQTAALPFTVVIGPDGRIRQRILGRFRLDELRRVARAAAS